MQIQENSSWTLSSPPAHGKHSSVTLREKGHVLELSARLRLLILLLPHWMEKTIKGETSRKQLTGFIFFFSLSSSSPTPFSSASFFSSFYSSTNSTTSSLSPPPSTTASFISSSSSSPLSFATSSSSSTFSTGWRRRWNEKLAGSSYKGSSSPLPNSSFCFTPFFGKLILLHLLLFYHLHHLIIGLIVLLLSALPLHLVLLLLLLQVCAADSRQEVSIAGRTIGSS